MYSTVYVQNVRVCRMHFWFNIHLPERLHSKNCFYWCFTHSISLSFYISFSPLSPKQTEKSYWFGVHSVVLFLFIRTVTLLQCRASSSPTEWIIWFSLSFTTHHYCRVLSLNPPPSFYCRILSLNLPIPVVVGPLIFLTLPVPIVFLGPFT